MQVESAFVRQRLHGANFDEIGQALSMSPSGMCEA
jgi:hypothetical protein